MKHVFSVKEVTNKLSLLKLCYVIIIFILILTHDEHKQNYYKNGKEYKELCLTTWKIKQFVQIQTHSEYNAVKWTFFRYKL